MCIRDRRYVASFLGSAGAVTVVSSLHTQGGFSQVFLVLSGIAFTALIAALLLPRVGDSASPASAAASPATSGKSA